MLLLSAALEARADKPVVFLRLGVRATKCVRRVELGMGAVPRHLVWTIHNCNTEMAIGAGYGSEDLQGTLP